MKRERLLVIGLTGLLFFGMLALGPITARADVGSWQKGATVYARWNTDFSSDSFKQSMRNLAATHANYVTLHIPLHQTNVNSTDVYIGGDAPTDQSLVDGIKYIRSLGMNVALKFQVQPNDGQWSAYINPSDRTTWFANYGNAIVHFAQIGQANGATEIVIGEELIDMSSANVNSTNTSNWLSLIARVRGVFSGKLTYSANWGGDNFNNEVAHVNFWGALDQIGISAYYGLAGDNSVSNLKNQWNNWNQSDITPLEAKWGKPIIFTEIGYKNLTTANQNPWMWWQGGSDDETAQANDYEAMFEYWNNYPFMQGVYFWYWSTDPNYGGAGNTDYTPQNKQAQTTMTTWFGQSGNIGGSGGGNPPPGGSFTANATANPGNPSPGQSTAFSINLTDGGAAASGDLVDVEIYNSSKAKVMQQTFQNQSFGAGGSQAYSANWTSGAIGAYTLKIGVFNNDWSSIYYWGDNVLAFNVGSSSVGSSGSSTSTSTGIVDIWWPTDGSTVSGVQPFKALLENTPLSNYSMFWQVDGDRLNQMLDNMNGGAHKEFEVDTSQWNWNGAGPYTVNFVAKDANGAVLGQKSTKINVVH